MAWMRAGVPVTLLIDLLDPRGPDSAAILVAEGRRRPAAATEPWLSALIGHVAEQFELPAADLL